jgi:uncharacterized protein (DUF1330 family)
VPLCLGGERICQVDFVLKGRKEKMNYYFFANIRIKNKKEYQNYINKAGEVFQKYNGEYLAVDNNPKILEGNWNYTRSVLIKFKNKSDFDSWYNSDDYQKILRHRLFASECDTILVKGIDVNR